MLASTLPIQTLLYFRLQNLRFHQYSCNEVKMFHLLIVKMYVSALNGCLIYGLNWWFLDSFLHCLTSSNDSCLGLKWLINCLCALTIAFTYLLLNRGLNLSITGEKLFFYVQRRENQCVLSVIQTVFLIPPSEYLLARNSRRKKEKSVAQ